MLSHFIMVPRSMPPLTFSYTEFPNAIFPFVASGNRPFAPEERRQARELCTDMFGQGGVDFDSSVTGRRWFIASNHCLVSFVSETDRLMFVTAFSGSTNGF